MLRHPPAQATDRVCEATELAPNSMMELIRLITYLNTIVIRCRKGPARASLRGLSLRIKRACCREEILFKGDSSGKPYNAHFSVSPCPHLIAFCRRRRHILAKTL